jgi:hypothetical protein
MIDILEVHNRDQTLVFEHVRTEVIESLLIVHVPRHLVAFEVLIDPVVLEVDVTPDVPLAALNDDRVKVEFKDLLVDGERVLQVLLITLTDMADRPVEGLAREATVNLGHEALKSLLGHEARDHRISFGLNSGKDFACCRDHCSIPP